MLSVENVLKKNCNKISNFNFHDQTNGLCCYEHKIEDMINVKDKKCKNNCGKLVSNHKYKGFCLRCFIFLFPNEKITRNYKVKEQHVIEFLKESYTNIFTFDKAVDGGCSKKRPDAYIDLLTHVLIIECDENQHNNYNCENKRVMGLFIDFGNRPIVFIRFNPDGYVDENNIKVVSSFKYHGSLDVPMIRDKDEWLNRLNCLKQLIDNSLVAIPEKEITNHYLFYNFKK
jgi:hypothetical protein